MPGARDPVAGRLRAGGRALLLLADPVSVSILLHLGSGPLESAELLEGIRFASRSTYFERMRDMEELSLVARTRHSGVPPTVECRLTGQGERLLPVAARLDIWLSQAPSGPLKLGEAYSAGTIKALAVAWGSTLLRWLAERPRSLTELERLVHVFGYRKLERILRDLTAAGLIERGPVEGRVSPYRVADWARSAANLLTAAMRWERDEVPNQSAVVSSIEAEGVMLLGLPMIELPTSTSGTCALLVDASDSTECLGGAVVRLLDGRPASWEAVGNSNPEAIEAGADCWVRGTTLAWLGAHSDAPQAFEVGGDADLAEKVMAGLREMGSRRPLLSVGERGTASDF
jgi:DNA-binding HxlR family transcriptional regulator